MKTTVIQLMHKASYSTLFLFLYGCATGTLAMQETHMEKRLAETPYIKTLTSTTYTPRTKAEDIQIFGKTWNALTAPNAITDWQNHFQVVEGSKLSRKYIAVAEITHYQRTLDDAAAVRYLKTVSASHGGDALIDVWKSPALEGLALPSNILGYRYLATVVRFSDKE
jgi:hypothetical protein